MRKFVEKDWAKLKKIGLGKLYGTIECNMIGDEGLEILLKSLPRKI